jgi:laminin alpha 3/5
LVDVDVSKPSLYRLIFRYVNPTDDRIMADVSVIPGSSSDVEQNSQVAFEPSMIPQFVTVSGGGLVSTFVLNPGRWSISLKTAEKLYVVMHPLFSSCLF